MKQGTRRATVAVALLVLVVGSVVRAEMVDRIAAIVNNDIIAYSEVEQRAAPELARLGQMDPAKRPEARHKILLAALDQLIADKLLESQMNELGIVVSDQDIDVAIEDIQRQNGLNPQQFEQALSQEGLSMSRYREEMRKNLRRLKLINLKLRSRVKLSEQDLRAEYERWKKLQDETEVHARHILVPVAEEATPAEVEAAKKKALAIAEQARKPGVDFAELAKKEGAGASAKEGGDLGFFRRGLMLPEFDRVVFSMKPGDVSEPVRTKFGWHVIKVEETRPIPVKPFEEVKPELQDRLMRAQLDKYTDQYVHELRQQAAVEVKI